SAVAPSRAMRLPPCSLVGLAAVAGACSASPPAIPPPAPPPPPPPALASWTPFDAPPLESSTQARVQSGDRELRLDAGGARWLYRPGAEPVRSEGFETAPIDGIALSDRGTVASTRDGHLLYAPDDVGPFQTIADLPPGEALALSVYRGGVTIRTRS